MLLGFVSAPSCPLGAGLGVRGVCVPSDDTLRLRAGRRVVGGRGRAVRRMGAWGVRCATAGGAQGGAAAALPARAAFVRRRRIVFLAMLLGYSVYYVGRSTFVFSAPVMQRELGLSLTDVGVITSAFPSVYGVAKLFGGVVADVNSPRIVLAGGLLAVAACNAAFALGTGGVPYFAGLWGALGLVSSVGFPACAKLLSTWYPAAERGRAWGTLNISLNFGGLVSPVLVGTLASALGWRYGILLPAVIAAFTGLATYVAVADSPAVAGVGSGAAAVLPHSVRQPAKARKSRGGLLEQLLGAVAAFRRQLLEGVLVHRSVWLLAMAYFFVYIVRQALTSWSVFYIMEKGGISLAEAAVRVSGLEIGGLLGSVSSGWASDFLIARDSTAGAVGQRIKTALVYTFLTACGIYAFYVVPITPALLPVQWIIFAFVGACLYGPQLLVGLSGAELVSPSCAGTSNGFLGLTAYTGAALAGLPLSLVVRRLGFDWFFGVLLACCVATAALILPLIRRRSYEQDHSS